MYSALKVNGKKLYELAREGKVVERKARPVKILGYPDHRNGSSAGPYGGVVFQRNLYQDSLPRYRRTAWMWRMYGITDPYKSIGVQIKDAKTLEEIGALKQEGMLEEILVPIDEMFPLYPKITVKDDWKAFAKNGNRWMRRC